MESSDLGTHRFEDFFFLGSEKGYDGVPRVLPFLNLFKSAVDQVEGFGHIELLELLTFFLAVHLVPMDFLIHDEGKAFPLGHPHLLCYLFQGIPNARVGRYGRGFLVFLGLFHDISIL